jgi:phosphohistidine phosphatase
MIFGHNYAFTSIVNRFGSTFIDNLPTCGLVWIQFDINSWKEIKTGITKLVIKPKDLKN